MHYLALATDYDGTLASEGTVDQFTLAALQRARQVGVKLILVTGRELSDLFNNFPHGHLFDRIVVENGALLYNPADGTTRSLSSAPPPEFLRKLMDQQVPFSVGHSIVATVEPHESTVLAAIRDLRIEWQLVFNKGAVMALPSGVTKATGLQPALSELKIRPEQTVGVGDAENDHAFLELCGLAVAVANALPSVKASANIVTKGAHGEGVVELIDRLVRNDLPICAA